MKNIVAATLRLITIGLLLMLVGLATMSTAAAQLETFLVRASDGSYYQYHSEALNRAYLRAQINPDAVAGTQMYRHFEGLLTAGGTVVGLKDSDRGYFDYQAICAAHISAQLAQQGFDVNAYFGCEDAKKLAAPVTGLTASILTAVSTAASSWKKPPAGRFGLSPPGSMAWKW